MVKWLPRRIQQKEELSSDSSYSSERDYHYYCQTLKVFKLLNCLELRPLEHLKSAICLGKFPQLFESFRPCLLTVHLKCIHLGTHMSNWKWGTCHIFGFGQIFRCLVISCSSCPLLIFQDSVVCLTMYNYKGELIY